ncbi:serine/threonine protein kinase [Candidatus Uabimicrobium sp. HlEnr_7]|uniref:serine/threonine protein kinase n=1 Tax=Candidatus Uabimicrobium helgolandensis TaxID=3095367 RepID=UPI0035567A8D
MDENILFAHIAISKKYLTEDQVRSAIGKLQQNPTMNLSLICIKNKWITKEIFDQINNEVEQKLNSQNEQLEKSVKDLKVRVTQQMKVVEKKPSSSILKKVALMQDRPTQVIHKSEIEKAIETVNEDNVVIPQNIRKKVEAIQDYPTQEMQALDIESSDDLVTDDIVVRRPTQTMRSMSSQGIPKDLTINSSVSLPEKQAEDNNDIPSEIVKKVEAIQDHPTQIMKKVDVESSLDLLQNNKEDFVQNRLVIPQTKILESQKKSKKQQAMIPGNFLQMFENHEILGEIARGGMGIVYKAKQKDNNRLVAIKVMKRFDATNPKYVARFHREIEAAGKLNHPNIVAIYDAGEIDGTPYFTMEYVEGLTLSDYRKKWRINMNESVRIMKKVALAISHAHRHHIIHRDLKPANIIIDNDGEPHITDFGLAKDTSMAIDLTQSGIVLGTPYYMSPEQALANKNQIGAASDVFAMGVMLYELLSEKLPFTADDVSHLYRKIAYDRPRKIKKINRRVPANLETIVEKAMSKKPARRYESAKAFSEDLERYLNNEPIMAKPPTIFHIITDEVERHQFAVLGALFVFLLICAFYVIVVWKP